MSLRDDPLIQDYIARIDSEIQNRMFAISNGDAADYAVYQRKVGIIKGLQEALALLNDSISNYLDDSEEDDI